MVLLFLLYVLSYWWSNSKTETSDVTGGLYTGTNPLLLSRFPNENTFEIKQNESQLEFDDKTEFVGFPGNYWQKSQKLSKKYLNRRSHTEFHIVMAMHEQRKLGSQILQKVTPIRP